MQTHPKKKIEIIIEAPLVDQVTDALNDLGAKGYTVLPSAGGRGFEGQWREGQITSAQHMMVVIAIVDPETAERALDRLFPVVERYEGIIYTADVDVLRADRF